MSLLKGPFAKNTFWLNLLDLFKKNVLHQTFKSFNTTFGPRWKGLKIIYQVRQALAIFRNLVALVLGQNCIENLRITKYIEKINFEEVWGQVRSKSLFPETILENIKDKP